MWLYTLFNDLIDGGGSLAGKDEIVVLEKTKLVSEEREGQHENTKNALLDFVSNLIK